MLSRRQFIISTSLAGLFIGKSDSVWSNQAPTTITIPPGSTGQRIVIDNTGLHVFNAANVEVITIQANDTSHGNVPDILIGPSTGAQLSLRDNGGSGSMLINWPTTDYQFGGITLGAPSPVLAGSQATLSFSSPRNTNQDYVFLEMFSGSKDTLTPASLLIGTVRSGVTSNPLVIDAVNGMTWTALPFLIDTHSGSSSATFGIGSMPKGKQYYEEWGFSNLSIASSTSVSAPASAGAQMAVMHFISDYSINSAMNLSTAVWTSPDDGVYDIDFSWAWTPWVANSRFILFAFQNVIQTSNAIMHIDETSTTGFEQRHAKRFFAANDTCAFRVAQVTGANAATVGNTFQSYISIKRVF